MTDNQKTCNHIFVGRADGVHCTICGLHLTAQQYHDFLNPPENQQEEEKTTESTEPAQEKPKRTRRKKEVKNDE